ncbi:sigma-70 family RNA polymerase sigma factor [Amphibacillus jilinensis]|uniref:sigma-70 family RNA polymerase sigma factor n=1 Tax=Amphibacillus jilinensis TaxID=1216008 RepID=UPI00031FEA76|nr:sigma-70 family RNA polymerase sigma factor [Amphibacillus jilinensis]
MKRDFNKLLNDFEPMIFHLLNKYQVCDHDDEFYQELTITLWLASIHYQPGKMKFSTYAYNKMRYRLLDLFRKNYRTHRQEQKIYHETQSNAIYYESGYDHDYVLLDQIKGRLTGKEWTWFQGAILQGKTLVQIGQDSHVTANAVKHWKRKAVKKIIPIISS